MAAKKLAAEWKPEDPAGRRAVEILSRCLDLLSGAPRGRNWMVPFKNRNGIARFPSVYVVVSPCLVLYVGKSKNPRSRWFSHQQDADCRSLGAEWIIGIEAEVERIIAMESILIRELSPIFNVRGAQ